MHPSLMKAILLSLSLLLITGQLVGQTKDSIIFNSDNIKITKNFDDHKFSIQNLSTDEQIENLKFVKQIAYHFQVLDENNNIYYLNANGEKLAEVEDFYGVCGTVPHYELTVKENKRNFEVFEDETFYDAGNKIPAKKVYEFDKKNVDSVLFINGSDGMIFTSNFSVGIGSTDPTMVLLVKDGQYFTMDTPTDTYDSIDFSNYHHSLKTMKDDLYGLLGIIEPKYKNIEVFEYYLAKATTTDGSTVFIDLEGNEY